MQPTKDTFYLALRERLATINPARIVVVNGATRPALLVVENELPSTAPPEPDVFYLRWGAVRAVKGSLSAYRPLMALECAITYVADGTDVTAQDRGRQLSALDLELLQICAPPRAPKCDHSVTPPAALGTMIFWGTPEFDDVETTDDQGGELRRTARLSIFFFPEVDVA